MTHGRGKDGRRRPPDGTRFDMSRLTESDLRWLAAFEARRADFHQRLEEVNTRAHRCACPACGFPTLAARHDYEVCMICLWEDGVGERDPTRVGPPNYISLVEARINVARKLGEFEEEYVIDESMVEILVGIGRFAYLCERGEAQVGREDFTANLRMILPTRRRR